MTLKRWPKQKIEVLLNAANSNDAQVTVARFAVHFLGAAPVEAWKTRICSLAA